MNLVNSAHIACNLCELHMNETISIQCHLSVMCCHQDGQTALIEAASRGKSDVVVELLKAGAQVDQKNKVWKRHMHNISLYE